MKNEMWLDIALKILGVFSLLGGAFALFWKRERKSANVVISKTEAETYKNIVENKLADLNLVEVIDAKVQQHIKEFKDMLWDAQQEHYKVKLDAQERLIKVLKEKNELVQENEMLRNELVEMREEHQSCLTQIEDLRREVEKLKHNKS